VSADVKRLEAKVAKLSAEEAVARKVSGEAYDRWGDVQRALAEARGQLELARDPPSYKALVGRLGPEAVRRIEERALEVLKGRNRTPQPDRPARRGYAVCDLATELARAHPCWRDGVDRDGPVIATAGATHWARMIVDAVEKRMKEVQACPTTTSPSSSSSPSEPPSSSPPDP
jgi:hypothetical protein